MELLYLPAKHEAASNSVLKIQCRMARKQCPEAY